ncbi:hypothetical protein [Lysobacter sp. Root667]|uniref:hypothetical protein n=1 Tax=Lysobacter sp. Root667 TaxID=1736581 RepID=UPI000A757BE4|nr:hypothetical protein [Lysobacter sp. Root667]
MPPTALTDPAFDRVVSLRDAYRIMERFASAYLARGDTAVSDFLHAYAGEVGDGQTTDPAAAQDFLMAAESMTGEQQVYLVLHLHVLPGEFEDIKVIGVYRSEANALLAIERLRQQPGFCDLSELREPEDEDQQGFHICPYTVDMDHWDQGFVTV